VLVQVNTWGEERKFSPPPEEALMTLAVLSGDKAHLGACLRMLGALMNCLREVVPGGISLV
jgi:hypothetical protein